jgi:hypothetical protein
MQPRRVIILLTVIVAASGCMSDNSQSGISVQEVSVEPQEIIAGNEVSVSVQVQNTGLLEGEVYPGEENGNNILTNYCPDYFNIDNFRSSSSVPSESDSQGYTIGEGDVIEFNWRLNQNNKAKVPLTGIDCNLRFEIPFNYSARAYKQMQVLEDDDVETEAKLQTEITDGPLTFDMRIIGSTADQGNTIINGENTSIYITAYNQQSTENTEYSGIVEMGDLEISSSNLFDIDDECLDKATLASQEEKIYRCDIDIEQDAFNAPSSRGEVALNVDYTYIRDLGDRTIKVNPRGN